MRSAHTPVDNLSGNSGQPGAHDSNDVHAYLPPGWHLHKDEDGQVFYYHDDGHSTSWDFPDWIPEGWVPPSDFFTQPHVAYEAVHPDEHPAGRGGRGHARGATTHVVAPDGANWIAMAADAGERYYYNERTGESSWDKPLGGHSVHGPADSSAVGIEMQENAMYFHDS